MADNLFDTVGNINKALDLSAKLVGSAEQDDTGFFFVDEDTLMELHKALFKLGYKMDGD